MSSFFSSWFGSSSTSTTNAAVSNETSTTTPSSTTAASEDNATIPSSTNPAPNTERNRKKRLAKKRSKQKRQSMAHGEVGGGGDSDVEGGGEGDDGEFPDADEDLSYLPVEPDDVSTLANRATVGSAATTTKGPIESGVAQPSTIPPQEVIEALSRLPPPLPNHEALPNDPRTKRTIRSQGFVPVEDENGGLHVGVKVREGVVAVMGKDGPILFGM